MTIDVPSVCIDADTRETSSPASTRSLVTRRMTGGERANPSQENDMIAVNKLLTAVLSGSPSTGQVGAEGARSLDRGGRAGLSDFFGANVGALGTAR